MKICSVVLILFYLLGCSSSKKLPTTARGFSISSIKLIDEYVIPHKLNFANTAVGGLSGIDYNESKNNFFLISDDRSNLNAARFYTADIRIKNDCIDSIIFLAVDSLRNFRGELFPPHRQQPQLSPDPESIRYNALSNSLIWTSEGERDIKGGNTFLQQPFIYEMYLDGQFRDSFILPSNLKVQVANKGPRRNSVFEGSSYTSDYNFLFVSCEEPLLQDGPVAAVNYNGALTRISKFNTKTKKAIAQFAYPLDAIAYAPKPSNAFAVNGISEILSVDENNLLVVERSFSTGRLINTIKIFIADLSKADNVLHKDSLTNSSSRPAQKKLLFDSDVLERYFDNVEGICFGPQLTNGHRSLLLVVDDNFNPLEKMQVFLLEIIP